MPDIDWIHEEVPCHKCGTTWIIHALGWAALPHPDTFTCPDCTTYKGTLDWKGSE